MASFINLMANDVWSEADIVAHTEAELHSVVSAADELILSRKMIGYSLGRLVPTAEEADMLGHYQMAAYAAQQSGIAARADMALLSAVMECEGAAARLSLLPAGDDPDGLDAALRLQDHALLDGSSAEVRALYALRNPQHSGQQTEPQATQAAPQ